MGCGHTHAVVRHAGIERGGKDRLAITGAYPHLLAGGNANLGQGRRVHAGGRRRGILALLQRRRTAHQWVGEVDRHVGDPFQSNAASGSDTRR